MADTYRDRGWRIVLVVGGGLTLVGGFVGTVLSRGLDEVKDQPIGASIYGLGMLAFLAMILRAPFSGVFLSGDELKARTLVWTHRIARSSIVGVDLGFARGPTGALRLLLELSEGETRSIGLVGRYSTRRGAEEMVSGIESWLQDDGD